MLKTRIIPTLLWKNFGLVKGISFDSTRRVGSVMPAIKVYNTRDVDELILLDIAATEEVREPDYDAIEEYAAECFIPLTVGGGVKNIEMIKNLLRAGADKVVINSAAYDDPHLISQAASRFGVQCVVASIDARCNSDGKYECYSHCGKHPRSIAPKEWAMKLEDLGAGEIIITSIDKDGTMSGYDLELIRQVANNVNIPVIASGGAGNYEDLYKAICEGNASAVAAASIFHFTEQTPYEAKKYLNKNNIPIRDSRIRNQ